MKFYKLPNTSLTISKICLGSMTWGEQNTEAEGHQQLDCAVDHEINFIDTAEMYSVPGSKETQGSTERIIGTWFAKKKNRDQLVLATKVVGPNPGLSYIRNGPRYTKTQIREAIEGSLKRLQTDYIDIYQLHWPERKSNFFGKLDFVYDPTDPWEDNILEIIQLMNDLIQEGKIRHYGVSNETAWGLMHYIRLAEANDLEKPITIQNPYSLLNRSYEVGLAEVSIREKVGLLAYSPLAFGVLSGKYLNGNMPEQSRLKLFPQFSRYSNEIALKATAKYLDIANQHQLSLTQMALSYVNNRPFVASNIIGATTVEQLVENITSIDVNLSDEIIESINEVHKLYPTPAP